MLFFGRKKKDYTSSVQTVSKINDYNYPFGILDRYSPFSMAEYKLYSTLREAVPLIDAAISKILRLVGEFEIKCENKDIEYHLNRFLTNVQVNAGMKGTNNFLLSHLNQLLTYGTAIGEMVIDSESNNIIALYNASLEDVEIRVENSPLKFSVYTRKQDGSFSKIRYPELILISSLNPEPCQIYGNSIMKGLPFVSNILLKIYHSIGVNWERIGNIRFAVTYKPAADASERAYSRERATKIASEWSKAMKNTGNPSDFVAVGDVNIKVIGADNQILDSQVPVRQMLEQIVSKLSIPPFLLGLSWTTTETMSNQQAELLSSEVEAYRRNLNPIINKICNMWMRLNGYQSDIDIVWTTINLRDEVKLANARLMNAKASEIEFRLKNAQNS